MVLLYNNDVKDRSMKIGGILENSNLALYNIIAVSDVPGSAGSILKFFARREINLEYITESFTIKGRAVITFCIRNEFVEVVEKYIAEHDQAIAGLDITHIDDVSTIGIYGPHFKEKHSIAARFCGALGAAGINILGISSSISSVCCVIKTEDIEKAKRATLKRFELP